MPSFSWDTGVKEHPPTDFENPVRDGGTVADPHYRVTVCDNANFGRWKIHEGFVGGKDKVEIKHVGGSDLYNPPSGPGQHTGTKGEVQHDMGTEGSVDLVGHALPNTTPPTTEAFSEWDITITLPDGTKIKRRLRIRVIDCSHHGRGVPKGEPVPNPPLGG